MAGIDRRGEFELINELLAPLAAAHKGAAALENDAATLGVPQGQELVVTKDMMVAGVHFFPDDPPDLIARKLLRVNLSDLAAMGARPSAYLLGLALPRATEDRWLERFVEGLASDQAAYGMGLIGGDTVSTTGPLTLSLTAMGMVAAGEAISRSGASPGDKIVVTGTIGDAALGLLAARGQIDDPSGHLLDRYRLPQPRLAAGQAAAGLVSAGLDVSDGLVADIGHLCEVSDVGARIHVDQLPLSAAAQGALARNPELLDVILTGGDDYELVMTAPPIRLDRFGMAAIRTECKATVIGDVIRGSGVIVLDSQKNIVELKSSGFTHR